MPDIRKVSVALTGEQVVSIRAAVDAGEYATTSEIVREALREWQFKRQARQEATNRLREAWDRGKTSGQPAVLNFAELHDEARKRLKRASRRASA